MSDDVKELGKKKEAKKKEEKTFQIDICRSVSNYLNHDILRNAKVRFPRTFRVVTYDGVERRIIEIDENGICHQSNEDRVFGAFNRFLVENSLQTMELYGVGMRQIKDAIFWWVHTSETIPLPPLLEVGEGTSPCWHRWPYDTEKYLVEDGHERLREFEHFLNRCNGCGPALRMWVGSLFFPDSYRQQYVWLRGMGMNGKSSIIRLLRHVMGTASCAEDAAMADNQFWTSGLQHKRLVCFSDCNCYAFPGSQRFKSVSGGDPVRIEQKNKQPFTADLNCKFLFASNEKPSISSQLSDTRRVIYIEVDPIDCDPDPTYEDRLIENAPWIVANCIGHYVRHTQETGKKGPIPVDNSALEDLIAINEGGMEAELGSAFEFEDKSKELNVQRTRWLTTNEEMRKAFVALKFDRATVRKAIKWLETRGVVYKKIKTGAGETNRFWVGCRATRWGQQLVNSITGSYVVSDE